MTSVEVAYRKTAAAGVSGLGLLIALYDTLAGDLRRAAEAERRNDVPRRCQEAKHALLVIGHLEHWVEQGSGGELADKLKEFYATLRRKIIVAQAVRRPDLLEEQMAQVIRVRAEWQRMSDNGISAGPQLVAAIGSQLHSASSSPEPQQRRLSWSA